MNIIMKFLNNHCAKKFGKHQDNACNMIGIYKDEIADTYVSFAVPKNIFDTIFNEYVFSKELPFNLTAFDFYKWVWRFSSFNFFQKVYYIILNGKFLGKRKEYFVDEHINPTKP